MTPKRVLAGRRTAGDDDGPPAERRGSARGPNIVVVLADDFGWGDLASNGGTIAETPHLDRMAREGVRFTQFYVASPICSPSRCGIITGQFPARWRINSYLQTRAGNKACEMARDYLDPEDALRFHGSCRRRATPPRTSGSGTSAGAGTCGTRRNSRRMDMIAASAPGRAPSPTPTSPRRTGSGPTTTRSSGGTGRDGWSTRRSPSSRRTGLGPASSTSGSTTRTRPGCPRPRTRPGSSPPAWKR